MFAAFVAKLGEIVAPTEVIDSGVRRSLSNESMNEMMREVFDDKVVGGDVTRPLNDLVLITRPSTEFQIDTGETDVASATVSSDELHRQHPKFNWRNTGTASNSNSSIISAGHLFSVPTSAQANFIRAEIPVENILTNCNQLLNTVEHGLKRDRLFALSLSQELASSKYLNNMLVAQSALLEDSKSDKIDVKTENEELKRTFLLQIDDWKEEFAKTKLEASKQRKLLNGQLLAQQQSAEVEEILRKSAWEIELLGTREDNLIGLEAKRTSLCSKNNESTSNEEGLRKEFIVITDELNDNIRILQLQLEASQKQCKYAEESYRRVKEEHSTAMKFIDEYTESSSDDRKPFQTTEEHSQRITNISSTFREENVPNSSSSLKFLRNMLEKYENRILEVRKSTKEKSLNYERFIENLQKDNILLDEEISNLKITLSDNQTKFEIERRKLEKQIMPMHRSECKNKLEIASESISPDEYKLDSSMISTFVVKTDQECIICGSVRTQAQETLKNQINELQREIIKL